MRTTASVAGGLAVATIAALLAAAPGAQAAPGGKPASNPGCAVSLLPESTQPTLASPSKGAETVARLGSSLPVAASRNSMTPGHFTTTVRSDRSARLDACGRMFYLDEPVTGQAVGAALTPAPGTLSTSGDAFALSSRPGARRTIYLDFTGATLTDTQWNTAYGLPNGFVLAPYDTDTVPASFSTAEQNAIREIWLRVAEDYAPFDVNVTTAEPLPSALDRTTSSDLDYGATAVITNDTTISTSCGCGGIAYVNVFGITGTNHERYQPALVFANNLGAGTPKYVAEAATHEIGHNFGLSHDGVSGGAAYFQGQGAWAPIMGVGYYQPLTQWSRGEYTGANNLEDDIAKIALNAPVAADDHAATPGAATPLTSGWVDGVVAGAADSDWFSFTTSGGSATVTVTPQSVGGNLDVRLSVVGSDGTTVLATSNPVVPEPSPSRFGTTGLDAAATLTLPAGTYYAVVTCTGQGSPTATGYSAYASLGRYQIGVATDAYATLAVTQSTMPPGTVGSAFSTALAATGGSGAATWAVTGGQLPDGLTLSSAGLLSGNPTTVGSSSFTVTATDAVASMTASATFTVNVSVPLVVSTAALPAGTADMLYTAALAASGGSGATSWSLAAGTLPVGLRLTADGQIAGTPTAGGTWAFTVAVTDADGRRATRVLSITVASSTAPLAISTAAALPNAKRNVLYSTTLLATGGSGSRSWRLVGGLLPHGLTLSTGGVISGRPNRLGTWTFTVRVTDAAGGTASRTFTLRVA